MAQPAGDPVLQHLGSLLWGQFALWPMNFHMPWARQEEGGESVVLYNLQWHVSIPFIIYIHTVLNT